jgi:hypothetical protein
VRRPPASALVSSGFSVAPASSEVTPSAGPSSQSAKALPTPSSVNDTSIVATSSKWSSLHGIEPGSTHDLKIVALQSSNADKDARTSLPIILAPPETTLSAEELEKDKALFLSFAEKRGEKKKDSQQLQNEWLEDGEDEDINGFANTVEGTKAKRKVRNIVTMAQIQEQLSYATTFPFAEI